MAKATKELLDPRQTNFLAYFLDPKSATYSNALQSALKAGYAQEYAESMLYQLPDWLSENLGDVKRLLKAERNLDEMLDLDTVEPLIQNGTLVIDEAGNLIKRNNPQLLKEKKETTFFVAERLGKKKYAERKENINLDIPIPIYGARSTHPTYDSDRKAVPDEKENS